MCLFLLLLPMLLVSSPKKNHCQDQCQGAFPLFSSRSFRASGLTIKSLMHFELIFAYVKRNATPGGQSWRGECREESAECPEARA